MSVKFFIDKDKKTGEKTGRFPMIWVEPINAFIHWLPVTKVQMEYFLCDSPGKPYDEDWYNQLLGKNSRISPTQANKNNYWQLFLTGILPAETQRFAEWCGEGYQLPTLGDWNKTYEYFSNMTALDLSSALTQQDSSSVEISDRARKIIEKIDEISHERYVENRKVIDQMLMKMGVIEWVKVEKRGFEWGGMGQTDSRWYPLAGTPTNPDLPRDVKNESNRLFYYGFRLLFRK